MLKFILNYLVSSGKPLLAKITRFLWCTMTGNDKEKCGSKFLPSLMQNLIMAVFHFAILLKLKMKEEKKNINLPAVR